MQIETAEGRHNGENDIVRVFEETGFNSVGYEATFAETDTYGEVQLVNEYIHDNYRSKVVRSARLVIQNGKASVVRGSDGTVIAEMVVNEDYEE